jgi:hypothetical protein
MLKDILLNLLLFANARNDGKVADIFKEALDGGDDVEVFRLCLVNWLADKVVDPCSALPDELKEHSEAEPFPDDQVTPAGAGNIDNAVSEGDRLRYDRQTQIITLDGTPHKIEDPKAFAVYKAIADKCPEPLTKAMIQDRVTGCRGDKKIPHLLDSLPEELRKTISSGPNGYWLKLKPLPQRGK